ncbi:MAG: thiol:disulfide interchange protein DsbA/DsbL [Gammaproteobacteria bacterium]
MRSLRSLRFALAAVGLVASTAFASPTAPQNGAEYTTLAAPQPVQAVGKKIEVLEFFMYHCPHCNALEPTLEAWVKKQGDNIHFRRVHFPYSGPADPEAHLYLTLEAMGKSEEFMPKVFRAFHVERQRLMKDDVILDWVVKNGVDKTKFQETWNSFGVITKLKRLSTIAGAYKVDSVPALVVDGRFVTSPASVSQANKNLDETASVKALTQVLDALVAQAQKDKGAAPAKK